MKWAVAPDRRRVLAQPDSYGTCPACTAPVYSKCGEQIDWHWAHAVGEGVDCELGEGLDADEYTGWHIAIQTHARNLGAEIEATHPTKKRRADIRTGDTVIELQHSRIERDVVLGRELDWTPLGPMCWLWDAAQWKIKETANPAIFLVPDKPIVIGRTPIFVDLGGIGDPVGPGVHRVKWVSRAHKGKGWAVRFECTGFEVFGFIEELIQTPGMAQTLPATQKAAGRLAAAPDTADKAPKFCTAPSFDGTFSGTRCGLTATDDSEFCWAHLAAGTPSTAEREAS